MQAFPAWSFEGRVAVRDGKDGGSGRIRWREDGGTYEISLRAPVSATTWELAGDAGQCELRGIAPQPLRGVDPGELLARETGWHLPVAHARSWVRGLALDPGTARLGPLRDGLPRLLRGGRLGGRIPRMVAGGRRPAADAAPDHCAARPLGSATGDRRLESATCRSEGWSEWPAPAKLNLFLHVVGRRADGYHLLQTVFQLLDLGDTVRLRVRADAQVRRHAGAPGVADDDDLAVRAARLLQARAGSPARCRHRAGQADSRWAAGWAGAVRTRPRYWWR